MHHTHITCLSLTHTPTCLQRLLPSRGSRHGISSPSLLWREGSGEAKFLATPERWPYPAGCPTLLESPTCVSPGRTLQEISREEKRPQSSLLQVSKGRPSGEAWTVTSPGWTLSRDLMIITTRHPWPQRGAATGIPPAQDHRTTSSRYSEL